ncbi:hypothetical protein [Desertivirga brevis]|uniref:hypothetical protein n=1 Tax=Desertivirga brevis TaxID=2810310 RepID=UPI001A96B192|nr:hypothetical protein [Pedobacter sp. SYSU D00873]
MIRYFIYAFSMIFYVLTACKKEAPISNAMVGEWELAGSVNGMTGRMNKNTSGNGNLLKISRQSYERYDHWNLVESGSYSIRQENSILYNKRLNRIIFNEEFDSPRSFVTIESDQLTIWLDAFDGPSVTYKKLK